MIDERIIRNLNYLLRAYDGCNRLIVSVKNRLVHLNPDARPEHQDEIMAMEKIKASYGRKILKDLEFFRIWVKWLAKVPGIGPYIGGNLIMHYYFRFVPICKECGTDLVKQEKMGIPISSIDGPGGFKCPSCGKASKGEGVLQTRIEERDFPYISHWRSYMGRAPTACRECGVRMRPVSQGADAYRHLECPKCGGTSGVLPRMRKGQQIDYKKSGRNITFHAVQAFVKQGNGHRYREYYDKRKAYREQTHSDASKGHRHNMACNETAQLFLSHFWLVARELDGKTITKPWILEHGGHETFIPPYYWEEEEEN